MKRHLYTKINEYFENQPKYYTTSYPMYISDFIEIEVKERGNYSKSEVNKWIKKYNITDEELLWVATSPHVAARYQMDTNDWDNCEEVYNANPNEYDVIVIEDNEGVIIEESDDGDDGYLMKLTSDVWERFD